MRTVKKFKKGNQTTQYLIALIFTSLFFLSTLPTAFSHGDIYSVSIDPAEPLVLEEFKINIGVRNTDTTTNNYVLDVFVIKDGQIKYDTYFEFSLAPHKGVLFSPIFTPTYIGEYEVVVKLYDKYRSVLCHTEILKIEVISDIGPFDLALDVLSRNVVPGDDVPIIIKMINAGTKDTDVKIVVRMNCINKSDIQEEFFVFVEQKSSLDKSLKLRTCNEEGLHDITAKLILFDVTLAESLNQIVLNRTYFDFEVRAPKAIEIRQGEYKAFDIYIKNTASTTVNNLKMIIENVPSNWVSISPSTIVKIEPNETAMFIVNISIPIDAPAENYPIVIAVGGDETLIKKDSDFKIITGYAAEPEEGTEELPQPAKKLPYRLIIIFFAVGVVALALIIVLRRPRRQGPKIYKSEALEKIKHMTK